MKRNTATLAKYLVIIIALGLITAYVLFNTRLIVSGPQITEVSPASGSSFDDPFVIIEGKTKNVSFITLDDNPIFIDEAGNFRYQLLLSPGLSIIELYARGRFEKEKTILLEYVYNGTSTAPNSSLPEIKPELENESETATTSPEV